VIRSLMVAMAQNRIIGRNNKLPWYLPEDLKYFRQVTMGKPIIMGRKTFESIGKPLPGRTNIVVTRNPNWKQAGVIATDTLQMAFSRGESAAELNGGNEVVVIGGGQLYQEALTLVDRMYITKVHAEVKGDAWFPEIDKSLWHEVARKDFQATDPNPYAYSFVIYEKAGQ